LERGSEEIPKDFNVRIVVKIFKILGTKVNQGTDYGNNTSGVGRLLSS
jgi:hypothetical protein